MGYLENYGNWGMLNGVGEEFITESQNLRTQQEQEQERLRQEELTQKKLQIWRTSVVFTILGVSSLLVIIFFFKNQEAQLKQQAANTKVKLSLDNKIEHLLESIKLVGDNQKINKRWFKPSTELAPEVQSVLYQAVEKSRQRDVFNGHKDEVFAVAFSPDGKFLVSGSSDNKVKLWSVGNQSPVHNFKDHKDLINSVVFSRDGNYFLSGSSDNTVKLWQGTDWQDWMEIGCERIRLHPALVSSKIDFAPGAAETCLKYGCWLNSEKAEFLVKQGLALAAESGKVDLATRKFRQASKLDPTNVDLAELTAEAKNLTTQVLIKEREVRGKR